MEIAYFSNTLNKHQVYLSDELCRTQGIVYHYVETVPPRMENLQQGGKLRVERPYVLCAFEDSTKWDEAMRLARDADVAIFGAGALAFEVERMRTTAGLAFEVSERWLKRGWRNLLSPRLMKNMWYYHTLFHNKPLYKLCSSAFGARDQYILHSFKNRCYKWGYFTEVKELEVEATPGVSTSKSATILWCARFLKWKHPERVIQLARRLLDDGYEVRIDMYGSGPELEVIRQLSETMGVNNIVTFCGNVANAEVLRAMRECDIFLFTSDKNEGWGAALNEAMSNCCAVVASDAIGSVPFLVDDGKNGLVFQSESLNSLYEKVTYLLQHPDERQQMAANAYRTMHDVWSPSEAAHRLVQLIKDLQAGQESSITEGPCSKAYPI